jgi:hypothetical protein
LLRDLIRQRGELRLLRGELRVALGEVVSSDATRALSSLARRSSPSSLTAT